MARPYHLAAALLLSGCAMATSLKQGGTLILKPRIADGTYGTKTTITPYTKTSIDHLILKIYTYDGTEHDQNIQKTLPNAQLDNPIVFSNLKANTHYRVRCYAYATSNESTLISDNLTSYTDITLTNGDRPTVAPLQVNLLDKAFNGQATSSISVTPGGYALSGPEEGAWYQSILSTLAGTLGASGSVNGFGTAASFCDPIGVALDSSGNLYVADRSNHVIRKVTPSGAVSTLAGGMGTPGSVDATGTDARFSSPYGVAVDSSGNVYVADNQNHAVRKITPSGVVSTLAGTLGSSGSVDATGTNASFYYLLGVAVDAAGNVYVADEYNSTIRKVTSAGVVSTLAGLAGATGKVDGTGSNARFKKATGVAVDSAGNVFVVDRGNNAIRKITPGGVVTTIAGNVSGGLDGTGTSARFKSPYGITVDPSGNLYVSDVSNHAIRKITPNGVVSTLVGALGTLGGVDGPGINVPCLNAPYGLAIDSAGNIYVGDRYNHAIRVIR